MVTYEEFERAELLKAEQQQKQYAAERMAAAETQIKALHKAADDVAADRRRQTEEKRQKAVAAFTEEYAQNALQQAVNARRMRQYLSDHGLTESGVARRTVQEDTVQKQTADAAVSAEANRETVELMSKLSAFLAEEKAANEEKAAGLRATAEKDIAKNKTSLYKAARERATRQYKAALSAAAKGVAVK